MIRLAVLAIPLVCLAGPALAADLHPYEERESYAPPRVERKIVEHHHYYHQAPTIYRERRVYVEPRAYDSPTIYIDRYPRRAHAHRVWRPRHFFPRHRFGAHRHRHGW